MKIFGVQLWGRKSAVDPLSADSPGVGAILSPWLGPIREPFTGAWQRNVMADSRECIIAFSAVYACVTRIAGDIAKMRAVLKENVGGIWQPASEKSPFWAVLRKPNAFQTRVQFLESWLISILLSGNAYVLKERDSRGIVVALYVLDPRRVRPLVAQDGSIYYQIHADPLSGVPEATTLPASEIIHDRMNCLFHPLVGISPIYACAISTTQGNRIQANSAKFFENLSRPSGMLTAPGNIDNITAQRLKDEFETKFSNGGLGRLFVAGSGLKYEAMTINAVDAQLIEQLKWTVEDVARAFAMPLYKINAGPVPPYTSVEVLNQQYYTDALQTRVEAMECALDDGLGLGYEQAAAYGVVLDTSVLLRMDTAARYKAHSDGIAGGWLKPNEARAARVGPVDGSKPR